MAKRNGEIFDRIFKELQRHSELLERHSELLDRHSELLTKLVAIVTQQSEILGELQRDVRDIKYELKDINRRLSENVPAFGDHIIIETTDGKIIEGTLQHPSTLRSE